MKKFITLIVLITILIITGVAGWQYYNNISKPKQLTGLIMIGENCIYYKDKCYNNCMEENKDSPLSYKGFCIEECCLLNEKDLSNLLYIIMLIFFIGGGFLIYKKFRKK